MNDEATFHFLSLAEQYPCLWDTGSADYSKTNLKTSVWEQVAKEMMGRFPQFGPYSAGERTFFLFCLLNANVHCCPTFVKRILRQNDP